MNAPATNGAATLSAECAGSGEFAAPSACHRPLRCGPDSASVLGQHATLNAQGRLLPGTPALVQFRVGDVDTQPLGVRVDGNGVAVFQQGDRATDPRLRSNMADDQAVRAAGEAAVGNQADAVAETLADQRAGDG